MVSFLLVPLALAAVDSVKAQPVSQPVTIEFENQSWDIATVYAVPEHGLAQRLGQVSPGSTTRLVLPRTVMNGSTSVNIVARRLARSGAVASGPVTFVPGDSFRASLTTNGIVSVLPGR